jgi:kynureninase
MTKEAFLADSHVEAMQPWVAAPIRLGAAFGPSVGALIGA